MHGSARGVIAEAIGFLVIAAFLLNCSHPAARPAESGGTPTGQDASSQIRLKVPHTRCFVGPSLITVHILIPTTFKADSEIEERRILWSVSCRPGKTPECDGTGLFVSEIEGTGEITTGDSFSVTGAQVLSHTQTMATIEWLRNALTVDASAGMVTFSGSRLLVGYEGYGQAKCDHHGTPDTVVVP